MMYFIFAGDMLVMAFMIGLVIWVSLRSSSEYLQESAAIPLGDEVFEESNDSDDARLIARTVKEVRNG